jgi:hypothetical protein
LVSSNATICWIFGPPKKSGRIQADARERALGKLSKERQVRNSVLLSQFRALVANKHEANDSAEWCKAIDEREQNKTRAKPLKSNFHKAPALFNLKLTMCG